MNQEALRKLGKAAQRLAKLFGYTPETEASETPVQDDATFIEDAPRVGCPPPGTREDDGAPGKVTKPRWIETVARGPQRLFMVLYQSARAIARSRRYARRVGSISLHLPVDLLALHLGVDRTTIWRWAKELERKGLIARATHYGTLDGRTVATGTVWVVRLTPGRARITPEDLAHPWRDMEADRASGATAWAWIKAKRRPSLRVIVLWALGARYGPRGPAPGGGGGLSQPPRHLPPTGGLEGGASRPHHPPGGPPGGPNGRPGREKMVCRHPVERGQRGVAPSERD
jgi:hypothetical protein